MYNPPFGTNYVPQQSAPTPAQVKRSFTTHNNITGGGLLLYLALFLGLQIIPEVIYMVVYIYKHPDLTYDEIYNSTLDFCMNGWIYIGSLVAGLIALFLYFRKRLPVSDLFVTPRRMTVKTFFFLFVMIYAAQFIGQAISIALELFLNIFGYSNEEVAELMNEIFTHPSMIIYAAIFGPIAEELVFRGFLMRRFQAWGKVFAIVSSAILFGLFHMNYVQIPYAIVVGIVFGYVAMEYGIRWSIIYHIINNGLISFGFSFLGRNTSIGETKAEYLEIAFFAVCFIIGIPLFIISFKKLKEYIRENKTEKPRYFWGFTTATILLMVILSIGFASFTLFTSQGDPENIGNYSNVLTLTGIVTAAITALFLLIMYLISRKPSNSK
ncbi:MAG: CPBP family intramembrane metalloprotease [Ruminococcus sp.]|nr:CPBP family intramembrane metalloprotease [Ruminococcus sp.]